MRIRTFVFLFACLGAPLLAFAQEPSRTSPSAAKPQAISGTPSSGRYCLASNGTNVHQLGWIQNGSRYAVTFDGDVRVSSTLVRFDIATENVITVRGDPDLSLTASISAMTVLLVSSNGQSGCYRYQVTIDAPSAQLAAVDLSTLHRISDARDRSMRAVQQPNLASGPLAVSGSPSSADHCVAGDAVPLVHELGRVDSATDITVTFDADFPAISAVTLTKMDSSSSSTRFVVQKIANGALSFSAQAGDNIVLYVTGRNGTAGCYRYKVELR